VITFLSPVVANFALQFGPPEFFRRVLLTVLRVRRHVEGAAVQDDRVDDGPASRSPR
jgi:TctA family transporter